ncbi:MULTISPECIES: hypothetical protein, partial [unclassified Azospirillum]|uniref:hypothetical protein n=1 Tax=unclassified Azospirillum TaxID=2630922 RepID=UPI001B3BDEE0
MIHGYWYRRRLPPRGSCRVRASREKAESKDSLFGLDVIHLYRRWIMGKAYSEDLRERVEARIASGHSRRDAA